MDDRERPEDERSWAGEGDDLERASENVLGGLAERLGRGPRTALASEPGAGAAAVETRLADGGSPVA